jgi:hypothetical protein
VGTGILTKDGLNKKYCGWTKQGIKVYNKILEKVRANRLQFPGENNIFHCTIWHTKKYVINDILFDMSVVRAIMTFVCNNDIFNRSFTLNQNYVLNHIFLTFWICGLSDVAKTAHVKHTKNSMSDFMNNINSWETSSNGRNKELKFITNILDANKKD